MGQTYKKAGLLSLYRHATLARLFRKLDAKRCGDENTPMSCIQPCCEAILSGKQVNPATGADCVNESYHELSEGG